MSSIAPSTERREQRVVRPIAGWPLERVLFALAGTVTLVGTLLTVVVSPWFGLLTAFVGVNQWLYVVAGACPASIVLGRAFGLCSTMPRKEARA